MRVRQVSADFWQHPVSYFVNPVLAGHDRRKVIPYVYSDVARTDAATMRLRNLVHHRLDTCGMSDANLVKQIRRDGIDILVAFHTETLIRLPLLY